MGNKTRLQMRTDLALDLKITIDTELSKAELNRCIEKAFSDMSRYIPEGKIFEDSLQFTVSDESVTMPKDTDGSKVVNSESLNGKTAGNTCTIDGQPDVPRPLRYSITDADNSITGLTLIVDGIDKDDQAIQEVYSYTYGDDKVGVMGKKYFKAVYSVEIDQIAGNGTGDVLEIGYGAYTDVWVYLANSPVKWGSESVVGDDDTACTRNTDYYIDYANGRIKAISGGELSAEEVAEIDYEKSHIGIDLSNLPGLIRVQRIEYPVGDMPQTFVQFDVFGKYAVVTGSGESGGQELMAEDKQYRLYYDAAYQSPGEYSPSSAPEFLENTVILAAGAYGLYILALKQEHQAATDLTAARTALTAAGTAQTALGTALTNMKKYLDNNSDADAAGILADITTDAAALRTAVGTALDAMNAYLDAVGAATTGDIALSNLEPPKYMGATANYVTGGTEPDILAYLTTGDALLNKQNVGGEGQDVPRAYAEYARTVKEALVAAYENNRSLYLQGATARTNAAMGYANEAAQRLSNLRSYIEQAATYVTMANTFGVEAEHRLGVVMSYLQQALQYVGTANSDMASATRFREEADERRNEVYLIWRDRRQYIGDFTAGAVRQMPDYG